MKEMTINEMRKSLGISWKALGEATGYRWKSLADAQYRTHGKKLYWDIQQYYLREKGK